LRLQGTERRIPGRGLAVEGLFQSLAQGLADSYLSVLAVWLGASAPTLGIVAALPTTVTAVSQAAARRLNAGVRSARRFIAVSWSIQSAALALVGASVLVPRPLRIVSICVLATAAFAAAGVSIPRWTRLVFHSVPKTARGRFFGLRATLQQVGVLVAIAGGGLLLAACRRSGFEAAGFVWLFVAAGTLRLGGVAFRFKQLDPPPHAPEPARPRRLPRLGSAKIRRLAFYLWGLRFGTSVATPCFVPYMLRELEWSYFQVSVILATPALVKALTVRGWGRVADRVGPGPLLRASGWFVVPSAALWMLSTDPWWIALAQVYGGLAWGAQELAQASALVETTRGRESVIGLYNFVEGATIVVGSLVGGCLIWVLDSATSIGSGYLAVMGASTVLRAVPAATLLWRVRDIGRPLRSHLLLPLRLWAVRPTRGASLRPWTDLPDDDR